MREHAIPQDITGYRFHIIGNMTIKQFAEIAAGAVMGFLIYTTNLPVFIKWPLIAIVAGTGALAAFIPIQERPIDHWIITFFKALYKPTKFFWRREPKIPEPFLFEPNQATNSINQELDLRPARRERIREYLSSVQPAPEVNQFDLAEQAQISTIMATFSTETVTQVTSTELPQKPNLKVRLRPLMTQPEEVVTENIETQSVLQMSNLILDPQLEEAARMAQSQAVSQRANTDQVATSINIPEMPTITYQQTQFSAPTNDSQSNPLVEPEAVESRAYVTNEVPTQQPVGATQAAVTNIDLPFPTMPTEPNKVVGMALTPSNELINDAIVEIQAQDGRVVRAVKTNALGQFFITTPLDNGIYTIALERDGYQFVPQQLTVNGQVLPPVEIRSVT